MFLQPCLNYNKSFIINNNERGNGPRFLIKSRCIIKNLKNNEEEIFYQGPTMKSEKTYAKRWLFNKRYNYNFTPIFSEKEVLFIRYGKQVKAHKKRQIKLADTWGETKFHLHEERGKEIIFFDDIKRSIYNGDEIIAQTKLIKKNIEIILEYPIETINCDVNNHLWQVDTGPIMYLKEKDSEYFTNIYLAYIAFNCRNNDKDFSDIVNFILIDEKKDILLLEQGKTKLIIYK